MKEGGVLTIKTINRKNVDTKKCIKIECPFYGYGCEDYPEIDCIMSEKDLARIGLR